MYFLNLQAGKKQAATWFPLFCKPLEACSVPAARHFLQNLSKIPGSDNLQNGLVRKDNKNCKNKQ